MKRLSSRRILHVTASFIPTAESNPSRLLLLEDDLTNGQSICGVNIHSAETRSAVSGYTADQQSCSTGSRYNCSRLNICCLKEIMPVSKVIFLPRLATIKKQTFFTQLCKVFGRLKNFRRLNFLAWLQPPNLRKKNRRDFLWGEGGMYRGKNFPTKFCQNTMGVNFLWVSM